MLKRLLTKCCAFVFLSFEERKTFLCSVSEQTSPTSQTPPGGKQWSDVSFNKLAEAKGASHEKLQKIFHAIRKRNETAAEQHNIKSNGTEYASLRDLKK
jgi:hypothetical protein